MIAALLRSGPARCRSRQLAATLSCPPTNHLACGGVHSSTVFQGRIQSSARACSAQKPSRSRAPASYSAGVAFACAANAAAGANRRGSESRVSIWSFMKPRCVSALLDRNEWTLASARKDLARASDLLVLVEQHLLPLGQPAGHPPEREQ